MHVTTNHNTNCVWVLFVLTIGRDTLCDSPKLTLVGKWFRDHETESYKKIKGYILCL